MKKILVIDDEGWLREMVQLVLEQKKFLVLQADNGATGIETARAERPDLILCDVHMEQLDGYATLAALRHEPATATIPVILMTGLADNMGMRHGMELGADDYLAKPFSPDALCAAVEARLKKAQIVRAEAERRLAGGENANPTPPEILRLLDRILAAAEKLAAEKLPPEQVAGIAGEIHRTGLQLGGALGKFLTPPSAAKISS